MLPGGCLLCIFVSSQKYIPRSSVGRHFMGKTILHEAMKFLCGKWRDHPKTVTAWTSLLDDECFIPLLKQLTMNVVRLNTTRAICVMIQSIFQNSTFHSIFYCFKYIAWLIVNGIFFLILFIMKRRKVSCANVVMAEWLRWQTRNLLGYVCVGSWTLIG